jgi:transposase
MASHSKKGVRDGATLGFLDETGVSDRAIVHTTWSKKGVTPIIASSGGWKSRTVIGTILARPVGTYARIVFSILSHTVRSDDVIRYLELLKKRMRGRKLVLILDGLPAHRAKKVKAWIWQNKSWLTTHRFPGYAPELNPIEYVWSASKHKDLANTCPKNMQELEKRVRKSMQRINNSKTVLHGCLKASSLFC